MTTEVYRQLQELSLRESALANDVDRLLASSSQLSRDLSKLNLLRATTSSLQVGASALLSSLDGAAATAERISSSVRKLDAEQSRVKQTLHHVDEVKELRRCVRGLHEAMESRAWETAAEHIERAHAVPDDIARGGFAIQMVPTAEAPLEPMQTVREAADSLLVLFEREFQAAANKRDLQQITRFFKLFPQIHRPDRGLDLYAEFVSGIIAERAESALHVAAGPSTMLYAGLLTGLFEHIAKLLDMHAPLIHRFYGHNIDRVLDRVQVECDRQGIRILQTMFEDRGVKGKVAEVKTYSFSFLVSAFMSVNASSTSTTSGPASGLAPPAEREVDSKQLDALLTELSVCCSRFTLYRDFVRRLATDKEAPFILASGLGNLVAKMCEPAYETLESYFMRRSVERAFQLETLVEHEDEETAYSVSSTVDDVMFILRKVTSRALATGLPKTVTSTFAAVRRIIEQDYAGMIGRRLQDAQSRMQQSAGGGGVGIGALRGAGGLVVGGPGGAARAAAAQETEKRDRQVYVELLNAVALAAEYVDKIAVEHAAGHDLARLSRDLPTDSPHESCVRALEGLHTVRLRLSRALEEGINALYNHHIKNKVRPLVNDTFNGISYVLSAAQFEELGSAAEGTPAAGGEVGRRFSAGWEAILAPLRPGRPATSAAAIMAAKSTHHGLSPAGFDLLLRLSTRAFVRVLEKRIVGTRCNELGAIRLDRDISSIVKTCIAEASSIPRFQATVDDIAFYTTPEIAKQPLQKQYHPSADAEIRQRFERCREVCSVLTWEADDEAEATAQQDSQQQLQGGSSHRLIEELGLVKLSAEEVEAIRRECLIRS
ncbi:Golgi transport complex subunit 4 [Savitreella phatthalungensis]